MSFKNWVLNFNTKTFVSIVETFLSTNKRVFQQVAVFSDSQLRPVVERDVCVPSNWYVNCTPGGTFLDVNVELEATAQLSLTVSPAFVVIAVGTNDTGKHMVVDRAERHLIALLSTALKYFLTPKVR